MDRRALLKTGAAALVASRFPAPNIRAQSRPTLRVLGTHVTLRDEIRTKAQNDLGIDLEFLPGGDAEILHQASTRPDSFDVYVFPSAGASRPLQTPGDRG
jgi:putative spermidine/putrescine transport system substrate-binding protein